MLLRPALPPVFALPQTFPAACLIPLGVLLSLLGALALRGVPARAQAVEDPRSNRLLSALQRPQDIAPPAIDGDLADPAWKHGARAITFYDPQSGKPAPDQTEAILLYDK